MQLTNSTSGFFLSSIVYYLLNVFFPPAGLGEGTLTHDEDTLILPTAYRQDIPTQGQYSDYSNGEPVGEVIVGETVSEKAKSEAESGPWDGDQKNPDKDVIEVLRS